LLPPKQKWSNDPDFCATYINYYICNQMVLVPQFGDIVADHNAVSIFQQVFPNHTIRPISIDGIAAGGGGIHCVTQQQPFVT
jgi:agmatine deiminase